MRNFDGRRLRRGLTLVELMVALTISAIVLLVARSMLDVLAASDRRLAAAAAAADREANAERLLRALLARLEVGTEEAVPFIGDEHAARFTTWCDMPAGWQERCIVAISLDPADDASALAVNFPDGRRTILWREPADAELRYLESAAKGGRWLRRWGPGISAPLALGVVTRRAERADTTILRIGGRG